MAKRELSEDVARRFFGSLYEEPQALPSEEYDALVSRLVVRSATAANIVAGDQALQSLLINFVARNSKDIDQVRALAEGMGGIKARAVEEVVRAFPNANLDELVASAREAGFDVQVLK